MRLLLALLTLMPTFLFETHAYAAEPYKAPFWLPGGHLQTIFSALLSKSPAIKYRRERWELNDGDFIDVDWADALPENSLIPDFNAHSHDGQLALAETLTSRHMDQKKPVIVVFHGLEGNSQSQYAKSLIGAALSRGWHGAVIHFRGCSGEPNRLPRVYYAGDSLEIDTMLARVRSLYPENPIYAVGYSLGGNALLKWLGEFGANSMLNISKAVAVSAPIDLKASAVSLDNGLNRILYTPVFVDSMRPKALALSKRFPGLLDDKRINQAKTIHDIDNAVTSVLYGAEDASDYYSKNASKPFLKSITLPTLIINAKNDPFLPPQFLPAVNEVSRSVTLDYQEEGGHVGFYSPLSNNGNSWLPNRIMEFLEEN
jgi:predicted alpha/beta-fold hydrolase